MVAFPQQLDQSCNQKPALSPWTTSLVCKNGCSLLNIESHCEQEYKVCYYLKNTQKKDEKVHAFLTKADIFTKLVNVNVPKHLRNLCTQFDADML